jgi:BirA family transcriptional regulator, biotin operon repressor / biotin---[acetyl-CoA-carboxylase] ligase
MSDPTEDDIPDATLPAASPQHWGAEALWQQLEPLLPGLSVEVVARISSTNTALLERARVNISAIDEAAAELVQVRRSVESAAFGRRAADVQPCLLVAEHQTGGRGRMGRVWKAAPVASLTFSLSLPMNPPDWSGLSLAVGCALADALDPRTPGDASAPRIGLKWPNDLWLMEAGSDAGRLGRKLGGVLIETVAAGPRRLAVIGIGINVQPMHATELNTGYGCVQEIDPALTAPATLARVALPLVKALIEFNRRGFGAFVDRFAARDLLRGRAITTTQADVAEGIADGVSANGMLRVLTADGPREVGSGEVSVRLTPADGGAPDPQAEDA